MASTYIHLSGQDVSDKLLANAGLIDMKSIQKGKTILMQVECPQCHKLNPSDAKYCECGKVLDIKEAQRQIDDYKGMEDRMKLMESQMNKFLEASGKIDEIMAKANKLKEARGKKQ